MTSRTQAWIPSAVVMLIGCALADTFGLTWWQILILAVLFGIAGNVIPEGGSR